MSWLLRVRSDLRAVGEPIHVRTLAGLLAVIVSKDLLAVDVMQAFLVPPGQFHRAWIAGMPQLSLTPALIWTTRALTVIAFLSALALLHARREAAAVLLVLYGTVFLYDAVGYTSNLYMLVILLAICAAAPLHGTTVLWPRRLGQLTVTAMYLGAGLAKAEPHFLSGAVLEDLFFHYLGAYETWIGVRDVTLFRTLAALTLITELGLAIALWHPRTFRWAIAVGTLFHVSIDLLIPVRIFSYLVLASYVLFVPEPMLVRAKAALDRHLRVGMRAPACLLLAALFNLRDPFVAMQPFRVAAALLALAIYALVGLATRRRASVQETRQPRAPRLVVLRRAGPYVVTGYALLQMFAIAKPWLGYSKFFSWRMFSEVLTLKVDTQVLDEGRWKSAVFPNVQQRWSRKTFTYHWTSASEEQLYLRGYLSWLEREFGLAGQVRLTVSQSLFRAPPQRTIIGPN
jgi:hypothetical protein